MMSTDSSLSTSNSPTTETALSFLEQGRYELALQTYLQISDDDYTPDDWVNRAVCLLHLEQADAALAVCDRALALDAGHAQAWLFRGVALHRVGQHSEAYACYDRALGNDTERSTRSSPERFQMRSLQAVMKQLKNNRLLRLWVN